MYMKLIGRTFKVYEINLDYIKDKTSTNKKTS